ncbi:MAG: hypothetical protein JWO99_173 [Candidatus Saccharibacteria bacterium]|nr:hypothetical protein [Candidatus Saccharibacteria bacterium]
MIRKRNSSSEAFTIVELLIVIVVIGILAAITIVAYNGVTSKAQVASLQSALNSSAKIIENARTTAGTIAYPTTAPPDLDTSVTYANSVNAAILGGFCATKTTGSNTYMITSTNRTPHTGPGCTITNYVTNPSFETGVTSSGTGWAAGANATVAVNNTYGASTGSYSGVVTHSNTTSGGASAATSFSTTAGKQYSVTFAIRSASASIPTVNVTIHSGSVGGSTPSDATTVSITPTATFTRYTSTFTADNAISDIVFDITGITSGQSFALDSVMATEGVNAGSYIDPLTAAVITGVTTVWTWAGTAGASTSSGQAF